MHICNFLFLKFFQKQTKKTNNFSVGAWEQKGCKLLLWTEEINVLFIARSHSTTRQQVVQETGLSLQLVFFQADCGSRDVSPGVWINFLCCRCVQLFFNHTLGTLQ